MWAGPTQCWMDVLSRLSLKGGGGRPSSRQQKRTFTGTLSAAWSWGFLYFKGWRLAVGGWRRLAVGGWWLAAVGGWWSLEAVLKGSKKKWLLKDSPAYC